MTTQMRELILQCQRRRKINSQVVTVHMEDPNCDEEFEELEETDESPEMPSGHEVFLRHSVKIFKVKDGIFEVVNKDRTKSIWVIGGILLRMSCHRIW